MNLSSITTTIKSKAPSGQPSNTSPASNIQSSNTSQVGFILAGTTLKATVTESVKVTQTIRQQLVNAQFARIQTSVSLPENATQAQKLAVLPKQTAALLTEPSLLMVKIQTKSLQNWIFTSQPLKVGQKIQLIKTENGQLELKPNQLKNTSNLSTSTQNRPLNTPTTFSGASITANSSHTQAALDSLRAILPTLTSPDKNLKNLTELKKDVNLWIKSTRDTPQSAVDSSVKAFLAKSLHSLTQHTTTLSTTISHQQIKKAFDNSGITFEKKILDSAKNVSQYEKSISEQLDTIKKTDQKSLYLNLAKQLSISASQPNATALTDKALQTLFKIMGLPSSNFITGSHHVAAMPLLQQLSQLTMSQLQHIRYNQISQILKQVEASAEGVRGNGVSFEIPLRYNATYIPLHIEIGHTLLPDEDEQQKNEKNEERKSRKRTQWEVFLTLELDQVGKISVCVKTVSDVLPAQTKHCDTIPTVDTKLWVEDPQAYQLLNSHLPTLNLALEKEGFVNNTLTCINQPPPTTQKQHIASHLIDITT